MNELSMYNVLVRPLVTEKSTMQLEKGNQISFAVATWANKPQIKKAIETIYSVKVEAVQVSNVKGKAKRFGKLEGKRKDWKRAVVRLQEGQSIDLFDQGA
ncbi:50S ribosomal protein L23 [Magnetococcus sp. PR-3]|uniref:50S ribosomal protein L23 n=1 Tax=Magnetococcus sp. PR-3 TaxID=3120355 RepID=UPI002FCE0735